VRSKLQANETVALVVRKHWLVLAKPAIVLMGVLAYYVFRDKLMGLQVFLDSFAPYVLAFAVCWLLYAWLDRRTNIWVVTNFRLIDQWGVVTNNSKENTLDKINDITVEQTIYGRILNYGTVSVQTAAKEGETVIQFVENPQLLKNVLSEKREELTKAEPATGQTSRYSEDRVLKVPEGTVPPFAIGCPHCGGGVTIEYAKPELPRYFAEHSIQDDQGHTQGAEDDRAATVLDGRGWKNSKRI
jgi:uncharacterized membrane protein YdbT with pleckstrin-like domain